MIAAVRTTTGKACGKFILLGEHFVIRHGDAPAVPALAFPLRNLVCEVRVAANPHQHYRAILPGGEVRETVEALMARATYAAASSLRLDVSGQPLKVESQANFPVSRGFGSSAAFAVALVRALDSYRKTIIGDAATWDEIVKATEAIEQVFHGRPSGVDTAVILAERPVRFHDGAVVREIENRAVDFVLVDSGSRDNCAVLIKEVAGFRDRSPSQWERMAAGVRRLVDEAETALASGQAAAVGTAVREAHGILAELGLSSPSIEAIISEATGLGALAGKVSGAGGGGAVLLVAPKGEGRRLGQALKAAGRDVVGVEPAGGVDE